jgi:hypothetical protein
MFRPGLSFLAVAVMLYFLSWRMLNAHQWTPVRVPLVLSASQVTRAEFVADMKTTYFVQVDLKRCMPFGKQEAMGIPQIDWTIKQGNTSVGQHYSGRYWGKTIGYEIGTFHSEVGKQYVVEARVKQDATAFQIFNPQFEICVTPVDYVRYYVKSMLLGGLSFFVFLVSVVCLVVGWFQSRRRRVQKERGRS